MKTYRVGGFIRDQLLGLKPVDCDYVVVGATPQQMLSAGYKQVGKSFPVFLHPKTNQEYALARIEKKSGSGHTGFQINCSQSVTLEEDLSRRDLTINAIAQDEDGKLIDPFNGQKDLKLKKLRHISLAFKDDPLRILRVARFAAKLNFTVAKETMLLMTEMANTFELLTLSKERVLNELNKALGEKYSSLFFQVLYESNNLQLLFPNLVNIYPQIKHNSIIDQLITKQAKYQYIAIILAQNNQSLSINKLTLDKKLLKLMYNAQLIQEICQNNYINAQDLLQKLKQLDCFRNHELFIHISNNYLNYLKITYNKRMLNKLNSLVRLVTEINNTLLDELIQQNLTNQQFAIAKENLYLKIISQFMDLHKL